MTKLIFIYKAGSGIIKNIPGAVKKTFGGMSDCSLCNITHGPVHEKETWKQFVASLRSRAIFYHQDEIPSEIRRFLTASKIALPVILEETSTGWKVVVDSQELAVCKGDEQKLIKLLRPRIA